MPLQTYYYWSIVVPLYVGWRVAVANRMPITDCDEVYNYWEPLHFVMYQSGSQQTWEYAHEYALRTYAYLVPLHYISRILLYPLLSYAAQLTDHSIATDKLALFVLLRSTLAAFMAASELIWLYALTKKETLSNVMWSTLVLLTCTGMNHAAGALLPSATFMLAWLLASTAFLLQRHYTFCLVAILATLTTGWPFGTVVMIPMGLHILFKEWKRRKLLNLILVCVVMTAIIQGIVMVIDKQYYGRWLSPTWNIFQYNAAGSGDELYGVEPVTYYVKNLLLNLNFSAALGIVVYPILYYSHLRDWDLLTIVSCMYLWLAITVPRPHKEERFLFPIYPILCLSAVLTVDHSWNFVGRVMAGLSRHKELFRRQRNLLHAFVWIPVALISISRTAALSKYYTAPLTIYAALAQVETTTEPSLVCTCGEWYRFPSSFYLPDHVQLGFLPSSFEGQLPQAFSEFGSLPESQSVLQPFNDRNRQEKDRYVQRKDCSWIVDMEGSDDCAFADSGTIVARAPFLDADQTSSTLHRILYIPYLHERAIERGQVKYRDYVLYKL